MIAKMVVFSNTREETIRKMESAMCELVIRGIPVNVEKQLDILNDPLFKSGQYHTDFMQKRGG